MSQKYSLPRLSQFVSQTLTSDTNPNPVNITAEMARLQAKTAIMDNAILSKRIVAFSVIEAFGTIWLSNADIALP